jgi:hypothetical protein
MDLSVDIYFDDFEKFLVDLGAVSYRNKGVTYHCRCFDDSDTIIYCLFDDSKELVLDNFENRKDAVIKKVLMEHLLNKLFFRSTEIVTSFTSTMGYYNGREVFVEDYGYFMFIAGYIMQMVGKRSRRSHFADLVLKSCSWMAMLITLKMYIMLESYMKKKNMNDERIDVRVVDLELTQGDMTFLQYNIITENMSKIKDKIKLYRDLCKESYYFALDTEGPGLCLEMVDFVLTLIQKNESMLVILFLGFPEEQHSTLMQNDVINDIRSNQDIRDLLEPEEEVEVFII